MLDNRRFWIFVATFSITTLGLAIFLRTGRPVWLAATVVGHAELLIIGGHLYRTRNLPKGTK